MNRCFLVLAILLLSGQDLAACPLFSTCITQRIVKKTVKIQPRNETHEALLGAHSDMLSAHEHKLEAMDARIKAHEAVLFLLVRQTAELKKQIEAKK